MPALYPGLDKLSRPMEGYPPAGPPPQLPAVSKQRECCSEMFRMHCNTHQQTELKLLD